MTARTGWRLIHRARVKGASIALGPEGKILLDIPNRFPHRLLEELRSQREAVEVALTGEVEEEKELRQWFPKIGALVLDKETGRAGKLWGATKYGLIVDFGPGTPLLTLDPRSVSTR